MMLVKRVSIVDGIERSMELPVTPEEFKRLNSGMIYLEVKMVKKLIKDGKVAVLRGKGELAQNVWPNLTPSQREFIMTGITDEQWNDLFGGEDG